MFGDFSWNGKRTQEQETRFKRFVSDHQERALVLEFGAGTAVPSIRYLGEELMSQGADLIRINPREAEGPQGVISVSLSASKAIKELFL